MSHRREKKGVPQPASINPRLRKRQVEPIRSVEAWLTALREGDRVALAQAITQVESTQARHREQADALVAAALPHSGRSVRIGITGVPGVGKSTFIEAFGQLLIERGHHVAVLAVDPTSSRTGGSILGDKTRMETLSTHPDAFVRPSPAGSSLGGVTRSTAESIVLCEAAGYDVILVETVGVGQSETAVYSLTDLFLLLLLPNGGDELQGIKRGIVEMADMVLVHKADGSRIAAAKQAKRQYRNALHLMPMRESQQPVRVLLGSSMQGEGLAELWQAMQAHFDAVRANGYFEARRQSQSLDRFAERIERGLRARFEADEAVRQLLPELRRAVQRGEQSPYRAAEEVLQAFGGGNLTLGSDT